MRYALVQRTCFSEYWYSKCSRWRLKYRKIVESFLIALVQDKIFVFILIFSFQNPSLFLIASQPNVARLDESDFTFANSGAEGFTSSQDEDSGFTILADPCDMGDDYYCQTQQLAESCFKNFHQDCVDIDNWQDFDQDQIQGNNPCTWGPCYWCGAHSNAELCGLEWSQCETQYYNMQCVDAARPQWELPGRQGTEASESSDGDLDIGQFFKKRNLRIRIYMS